MRGFCIEAKVKLSSDWCLRLVDAGGREGGSSCYCRVECPNFYSENTFLLLKNKKSTFATTKMMLFEYDTSELISSPSGYYSIAQHPLYLSVPPSLLPFHVSVIGRGGGASTQLWPPPGQVHAAALAHHHHISNHQIVALMVARPTPGLHFGLIISVLLLRMVSSSAPVISLRPLTLSFYTDRHSLSHANLRGEDWLSRPICRPWSGTPERSCYQLQPQSDCSCVSYETWAAAWEAPHRGETVIIQTPSQPPL